MTICGDFQRFFEDKIGKIAEEIKSITNSGSLSSPVDFAYSISSSLRRLANISDEEVLRAIHNIPPKISPLVFIPTTILKSSSDVFAPLIATLANLSSSEVLQFGQGTLLLKKSGADDKDMANFRLITNLNTLGKILERLSQN